MSMTKTLTAAVIASVAIGGLAGCADNSEQVNKLDTQVKALSARVDKLGGGSESASSDDSAALKAEVSAIQKEVASLKLENEALKAKSAGATATAEVDALRLRDKELQDEINALKTGKPASASPATVAAGVDLATNDAAKFEALVADAVAKKQADDREKQRTEQRTRSREQFVGDFVRRLDTIAKDKNISEAEVTTIKAAYEKQYDQMAPLWEVMMGGGRGGFGGNNPDVTQEQRDEARKQMDTIRTETEATLKTSISQTSYDAVKGLFQPGGRQRGMGGGPTGDTGGAGSTPAPAGGDTGTATPAPRNNGRRNNNGGNGNGAGTGTDTPAPAGGRNTPRRGGNGNGN